MLFSNTNICTLGQPLHFVGIALISKKAPQGAFFDIENS
jgi:hypothetical protein